MVFNLREALRWFASPEKKRPLFATEKEAYNFCLQAYRDSGGVTPELRRAYEAYQAAQDDSGRPGQWSAPARDEAYCV